jgi:hypothetical protein
MLSVRPHFSFTQARAAKLVVFAHSVLKVLCVQGQGREQGSNGLADILKLAMPISIVPPFVGVQMAEYTVEAAPRARPGSRALGDGLGCVNSEAVLERKLNEPRIANRRDDLCQ